MTPATALGTTSPVIKNLTFFSEAGAGSSEKDTPPHTSPTSPLLGYVNDEDIRKIERRYGAMLDDHPGTHLRKPGMCYFMRYETSTLPIQKSLTLFQNVNFDYSSAHTSASSLIFTDETLGYDPRLTIGGEVYFNTDKEITLWHYKSGTYGGRTIDPASNPGFPAEKFVHFSVIDALDNYAKLHKLGSYLDLTLKPSAGIPYLWNPIGEALCERLTKSISEADQTLVVEALIRQYEAFGEALPTTEVEQSELADAFRAATRGMNSQITAISSASASGDIEYRGSPPSLM